MGPQFDDRMKGGNSSQLALAPTAGPQFGFDQGIPQTVGGGAAQNTSLGSELELSVYKSETGELMDALNPNNRLRNLEKPTWQAPWKLHKVI